ncbi:MAG TPA: hypothetical protein PLN31_00850 [Azoarcus taiwanensis]|nr:hypothetical protein [Azoarcus taiwanensis]
MSVALLSPSLAADDFLLGGARPACDPTVSSCLPDPEKPECDVTICFTTAEGQREYEMSHDCVFPPSSPCGEFDNTTQCCGRNPRTGEAAVIDKVFSTPGVLMPGFDSFTWTNLKMACPNRRQNDAPEDDAWKMCEVDKKHDPADDYLIIARWENGTARPYCIDGCSTPPLVVTTLVALGYFLENDRNNPTGYSDESSFLAACTDHDVCYQTCQKEQYECDTGLLSEMLSACTLIPHHALSVRWMPWPKIVSTRSHCMIAAEVMHRGLESFGHEAFNARRQQYCQCC